MHIGLGQQLSEKYYTHTRARARTHTLSLSLSLSLSLHNFFSQKSRRKVPNVSKLMADVRKLKLNSSIYLNINQLDALNFIMSLFHASTCFEHMCSSSGGQNRIIQPLVSSHDDTRGCIIRFWPPDDEYMCSKHVEAWNKLIIKFSASSWLILR